MSGHTQERIAHRISEIIGTMLVTGEIKQRNINPFVSVSRVVLSKDLAYATIYMTGTLSEEELEASAEALQRAAGFIQQRLAAVLKTRNTPRLSFKADIAYLEGEAVNKLLDQLARERGGEPNER